MDSAELRKILDGAFDLWTEMTGFDPESRFWSGITDQAKELMEARQIDSTGLTAFMLMKAFVVRYIEEEKISAFDVIRGLSKEQQKRIDLLRGVLDYLERPEVDAIIAQFVESIRRATQHYGIDHSDLEKWLEDYYWLAILRRDALRSMDKLETHQFYHGKPGTSERTVYGTKVLEFWNIPSLVRGMMAMGQRGYRGVNVCIIRDPLVSHSFFVIAIVNGESLTVLTDRTAQPHPAAKELKACRAPAREMRRRIEQNWFPYELLEVEFDEKCKVVWEERRDQLVPINAQAFELADFSTLHPADAIWLALVFRLVSDRFLADNEQLPEPSYTTEMVRSPNILLSARPEIVPHSTYKPLEALPLVLADVTAEATKEQWLSEPCGYNEWMIERYGEEVPTGVLNLIGEQDRKALPAGSLAPSLRKRDRWISETEPNPIDALRVADPLGFGTKEEIEADRVWTGRYNLCEAVQRKANAEFEETYASVLKWYERRVAKRVEWLAERIVSEEGIRVETTKDAGWNREGTEESDLVRQRVYGKKWYRNVMYAPFRAFHHGPWYDKDYTCAITEATALSYHAQIRPLRGQDIATILGVEFDALPWQLQQWTRDEHPYYSGNHLLQRVDPSDWVLRNPWSQNNYAGTSKKMCLTIVIHLSKRAVNAIRKRLGMPKLNWVAEIAEQKRKGLWG